MKMIIKEIHDTRLNDDYYEDLVKKYNLDKTVTLEYGKTTLEGAGKYHEPTWGPDGGDPGWAEDVTVDSFEYELSSDRILDELLSMSSPDPKEYLPQEVYAEYKRLDEEDRKEGTPTYYSGKAGDFLEKYVCEHFDEIVENPVVYNEMLELFKEEAEEYAAENYEEPEPDWEYDPD